MTRRAGQEPELMMIPADAPIVIRIPYLVGNPAQVSTEVRHVEVVVGRTATVTLPDGHTIRVVRDREHKRRRR